MSKELLFTHSLSPGINEVKIYFSQRGMPQAEAEHFFMFYEIKHWKSKNGNFYTSWKKLAHSWILSATSQQPWRFKKNVH